MSKTRIEGMRIAGISTCVPPRVLDNLQLGARFGDDEVRKVVSMAGIQYRPVVDAGVTSTDLCFEAAVPLLDQLGWSRESITGLIMVTQSPDYVLPSSSCVAHKWLGLSTDCATFDMGMGCSSYPYGLYIAGAMLRAGGQQRVLLLNGDTPSLFASPDDHGTSLLFADAGSATAIEWDDTAAPAFFNLHTDGSGYDGLIIRGGAFRDRFPADPRDNFLTMDGAGVFNFTIKRVPTLIRDALEFAGLTPDEVDQYLFHQSNRFMMKHLIKKCGLPAERVPFTLDRFGNCGGPSVPVALTNSRGATDPVPARVMFLGYGVGLSWGAATLSLRADTRLMHGVYTGQVARQ